MALYSSQFADIAGISSAVETYTNAFAWGRKESGIITNAIIDASSIDSGNATNTAQLRPGLLLGIITATGKYRDYLSTRTDGSQNAVAVLLEGVRMTDLLTGSTGDKMYGVLVGGPVQGSKVLGIDQNARCHMQNRFIFDDDLFGCRQPFKYLAKGGNYTVLASDNNTSFYATTGAVTFTLPTTIVQGTWFRFYNTVDANMAITAPSGKLIVDGNATATTATYSTTSHKIGSCCEVHSFDGSKYHLINLGATTVTPS